MGVRISVFLLACAAIHGDDSSPARLLNLNVVALDEHKQPVTDLMADDFQITDAGKSQKIVFFRRRDESRWESPHLAPKEFSNRTSAGIPHATVILFDLLNESFSTRGYATNQIIHALENLQNADYLYLYILDVQGRLFGVHGLPFGEEDAEPGSEPWTKKIKPLLDRARRDTLINRPVDVDVAVRVQVTFAGLAALTVQLSRVPGRKSVVWITDGVPAALGPVRSDTGEVVDFTPQMRALGQAMERSGVALYPVRELLPGAPDGIGATSGGAGATGGAGTGLQSIETLNEFADVTGGRRTAGRDIGSALAQAMEDARTSYQIGYYAPPHNWDGKFHKIRVVCKRKGVRIQAKSGYYAWPSPPGVESEQAMAPIVAAQFDAAEIGLRGTLERDPKDKTSGQLHAYIDAHDIAFVKNGNYYDGQLRISITGYTADSQVDRSKVLPFSLHLTVEEYQKALNGGIAVSKNFPIAQFVKIRLIVFDRGSNAIGSITFPVERPD